MQLIDLSGRQFGIWTVLERADNTNSGTPAWRCKCRCGTKRIVSGVNLRNKTSKSCGCLGIQRLRKQVGKNNPAWKGGYLNGHGYRVVSVNGKEVLEHRFVMSQHLNRNLFADEYVHHKNGNRADNRFENLELWVKHQPPGQRVEDIVKDALDKLKRYAPQELKDGKF